MQKRESIRKFLKIWIGGEKENGEEEVAENEEGELAGNIAGGKEEAGEKEEKEEPGRGAAGPLDGEALKSLEGHRHLGAESATSAEEIGRMMQHMLSPLHTCKQDVMPAHDALWRLEEYFPCLFACGCGGLLAFPGVIMLQEWIKHAKNADFLFFANAAPRKEHLSGLAAHSGIAANAKKMLKEIREVIGGGSSGSGRSRNEADIEGRISSVIRFGCLSASSEALVGAPALWKEIKKDAWSYLASFGPCQALMTLSAADAADPNAHMAADPALCRAETH